MFVIPLHSENALLPISVTLLGIFIFVIPLHPENALLPISVTLLGIIISTPLFSFALHNILSIIFVVPSSNSTLLIPVHP